MDPDDDWPSSVSNELVRDRACGTAKKVLLSPHSCVGDEMLCGEVGRLWSRSNEPLGRSSVGEPCDGCNPVVEDASPWTDRPVSDRVSIGTVWPISEDLRTAEVSIVMVGARGLRPGPGEGDARLALRLGEAML